MLKPLVFIANQDPSGFFKPLLEALAQAGFITQVGGEFAQALKNPEVDRDHVVLLGMRIGADELARNFYTYYEVQFPRAIVLLEPSVQTVDLNNITCPYLVIHGTPQGFARGSGASLHANQDGAVHHHQMRYGDATASYDIPFQAAAPESRSIAREVVSEVVGWLHSGAIAGLRPQEPAAA
jgi:pimeloyl-ACP methyl ester carboxylesterase